MIRKFFTLSDKTGIRGPDPDCLGPKNELFESDQGQNVWKFWDQIGPEATKLENSVDP